MDQLRKFWKYIKEGKFTPVLIVSLFLHLVVIYSISFPEFDSSKLFKKKKIQVVRLIKRSKKAKVQRQIVNTDQTGRKEKPLNSKFVGKSDQKFDRQTVAKKVASFNKAGRGSENGAKAAVAKTAPTRKKPRKITKAKKKITLKDLLIDRSAIKNPKIYKAAFKKALGSKSGDLKSKGLAANNDFIEDLPLGDMTKLNTSEYRFYGFYQRIRKKLENHWGKSLRDKAEEIFKRGGRMPAGRNNITNLTVYLDHGGNIVEILLKGSSGVRELDDAAIEAFNKAGPFPNPPRGMVKDGYAKIDWGFVAES